MQSDLESQSFKLERADYYFLGSNVWVLSGRICSIGNSQNTSLVSGSGNFICGGNIGALCGRRVIGITYISLEATEMGRPLYKKYGFVSMKDEMEYCEVVEGEITKICNISQSDISEGA